MTINTSLNELEDVELTQICCQHSGSSCAGYGYIFFYFVCYDAQLFQNRLLLILATTLNWEIVFVPSDRSMAGKSLNSCVFCQICGDNPSGTELLYSSDELVVFKDIKPAAKHHYLVVSREHIPDARAMSSAHKPLLEKMLAAADQVLREQGGDPADVRLGFHWPPFHSVSHLHLHVISPTADMGLIARMIFKQNSWWFVSPEYVMSRL